MAPHTQKRVEKRTRGWHELKSGHRRALLSTAPVRRPNWRGQFFMAFRPLLPKIRHWI